MKTAKESPTVRTESTLTNSERQSTGKAGKVQIIDATLKSLYGGSKLMYVPCTDSGKEQSDGSCQVQCCPWYRGRKEVISSDRNSRTLQIACDKEER